MLYAVVSAQRMMPPKKQEKAKPKQNYNAELGNKTENNNYSVGFSKKDCMMLCLCRDAGSFVCRSEGETHIL